jgi:hypothetical protein
MKEWEQLESETELAYEWFCRYRDMGAERSHAKVVQKYSKKNTYKTQLQKWSTKYNWIARVSAYDSHIGGQKLIEMENEQLRAAREHIHLADTVMELVLRKLAVLELKDINVNGLKGLAELAVKTKRDALGIAERFDVSGDIDVRQKVSQRIIDEVREINKDLLAIRDGKKND